MMLSHSTDSPAGGGGRGWGRGRGERINDGGSLRSPDRCAHGEQRARLGGQIAHGHAWLLREVMCGQLDRPQGVRGTRLSVRRQDRSAGCLGLRLACAVFRDEPAQLAVQGGLPVDPQLLVELLLGPEGLPRLNTMKRQQRGRPSQRLEHGHAHDVLADLERDEPASRRRPEVRRGYNPNWNK